MDKYSKIVEKFQIRILKLTKITNGSLTVYSLKKFIVNYTRKKTYTLCAHVNISFVNSWVMGHIGFVTVH